MLVWINDGAIAGTSEQQVPEENYPQGFILTEAPDLPLEQLYWDGQAVQEKPPQPSPSYYWSESERSWLLPEVPEISIAPDWQGLTSQLRGSAVWGRAYISSEKTLKANSAFTLLLTTLTSTHVIEDLVWAVARLREAMQGIGAVGDFPAEELEFLSQAIGDNHFDLDLFDLMPI